MDNSLKYQKNLYSNKAVSPTTQHRNPRHFSGQRVEKQQERMRVSSKYCSKQVWLKHLGQKLEVLASLEFLEFFYF